MPPSTNIRAHQKSIFVFINDIRWLLLHNFCFPLGNIAWRFLISLHVLLYSFQVLCSMLCVTYHSSERSEGLVKMLNAEEKKKERGTNQETDSLL